MISRYGKRIHWDAKAILGFGAAVTVILGLMQIPNYVSIWLWGPNTGYRSAGLSSGHYERRFPAILRGLPQIGLVLVTGQERLIVDYELAIDEGTASFSLWKWPTIANRPRDIGPRQIKVSDQGRIEVRVKGPGLYRILMYGHGLQGAVSVDWHTVSGWDD